MTEESGAFLTAPRGDCPVCGKHLTVRPDGKMSYHLRKEYDGQMVVIDTWGSECPGTYRSPAESAPQQGDDGA